MMMPPPTIFLPRTTCAPVRAETALVGAVTDNLEAAGEAEASVGMATSDSAITADVANLEKLMRTTPFKT